MYPLKRTLLLLLLSALPLTAAAVPVTYKIESYRDGNFSASWMHRASGCAAPSHYDGLSLYMCGAKRAITGGYLHGDLSGGLFHVSDKSYLTLASGETIGVLGGRLGGAFYGAGNLPLWSLFLDLGGVVRNWFVFEDLHMPSGKPNHFGPDHLILWGQNLAAYVGNRGGRGLDLYAHRVPEPATVALFGLGAIGLLAMRRRQGTERRKAV